MVLEMMMIYHILLLEKIFMKGWGIVLPNWVVCFAEWVVVGVGLVKCIE